MDDWSGDVARVAGVHQLLVHHAHRTAVEFLTPACALPKLGEEVLDAFWSALAEQAETVIAVSELLDRLWGVVASDPGVPDLYPDGDALAGEQEFFTQMATGVLSEYAGLQLLIMNPDETRVALTPLGRRAAQERLVASTGAGPEHD
jgi:hypothetical protein